MNPLFPSFYLQQLVNVLHSQSLQAIRVAGGVFVISPYSFATLRTASDVLVFESHVHGSDEALFACVPLSRAGEYLIFFLSERYKARFSFNIGSGAEHAHFTMLS